MATKNEFELIVSQGNRRLWARILAALLFTIVLFEIATLLLMLWVNGFISEILKSCQGKMELIGLGIAGGLHLSLTKTVLIDTDTDKLITRYHVGRFSWDSIGVVPEMEYVSTFRNGKDMFEVNLWYKGNKHYKMFVFEKKEPAMIFAEQVAQKLKIDLLDATERGNSKWIEIIKQ